MQSAPSDPIAKPARSSRIRTKLPVKTVTDLSSKGLDSVQIGKIVGAHPSTIRRFLDKIKPEVQSVKEFTSQRADTLATLQVKNLAIQDKLLDRLEDGLLNALTPQQISALVFALNTQHGTLYDKERLERGQSTQNLSVVSQMLRSRASNLYKQQAVVVSPDSDTTNTNVPSPTRAQDIDQQPDGEAAHPIREGRDPEVRGDISTSSTTSGPVGTSIE